MHFAGTLRALSRVNDTHLQVCYATHSPYFVVPDDFASVRVCRRTPDPSGTSAAPTTITAADAGAVAARLAEDQRENFERRLRRTLRPSFREAFFARAVLLVEGETDVAAFTQAGRMCGIDLSSHGIVVSGVTKSVLPLAIAILESLEIPTYVVFDGDHHQDSAQLCVMCGRGGRDTSNDGIVNQRILQTVGAPIEEFPATQHHDRWACFSVDLEHFLTEEGTRVQRQSRRDR